MPETKQIKDAAGVEESIRQLAGAIRARYGDAPPCFVGIHTRGVVLAHRVRECLRDAWPDLEMGELDISLYRDDLGEIGDLDRLKLRGTHLPVTLDGSDVVLFDEVIHTGRSTRAALALLMDFGRPARVDLAVLVDRRGCRELPLQPDFAAETIEADRDAHVQVRFSEVEEDGGEDAIYLTS